MIVRVVAASLLSLLCARTAYAQPQSLPDAERSSLLQQANEARTQGQWARVAELLQRALAIRPSVSVRAGLAGAYQELGRYQETAEQSTLCLQGAATDRDLGRYQLVGGASIYPFVWSILLAARAEGLGGVLTTVAITREPELKSLLGAPEEFAVAAVLALGYPERQPTRLRRDPVESFASVDTLDGPPLNSP